MKFNLEKHLEELALNRSIAFCYGCYQDATEGKCLSCGSDDLMRKISGIGVEYGTSWIVDHILRTELNPVNLEEAFEESLLGCYEETTQVGWMTLDTLDVMKTMDPISWKLAMSEWENSEAEEGNLYSNNGGHTFYWTHDIEGLS